jgi:ribonuclease D
MNIDIKLHKNDLPDDIKLGNVIAVDGEFMGLDVRRDPLCLIQISSGNSDAHIIQLDRSEYNAPNLIRVLADNTITKIFHYGRADIAHIKYYLKTETNNILDTKIASKLARSYSDSHSLKTLIKEFINVDISKQFQSSDFGGELTSCPTQILCKRCCLSS